MTVTTPPRPPRSSDPIDREELEALIEALFEEARQRQRRRRRRLAAVVTLVAVVGVALFALLRRSAQTRTASPAASARLNAAAQAGPSKIAFIRVVPNRSAALYVMNPDGSGQRRLSLGLEWDGTPVWSPDGQKIAFVSNEPRRKARRLRDERRRRQRAAAYA
jgi:hypothetical protein